MRIPPEPFDDRLVLQLVIQVTLDAVLPEQLHGDLVYFCGLAVHEWHVEEAALDRIQGLIRTSRDGFLRERKRQCVLRKRQRRAPEHVSGELIQDNDLRQSAAGVFLHSNSSQRVALR